VPSPFGEGCGDSPVASWLLRLLLTHATAASVFRKESTAPSSGHRRTLNSPMRRASLDMLCCVCGMSMESKSNHSHSGFGWSEVRNVTASCARAAAVKIARLSALIISSQCLSTARREPSPGLSSKAAALRRRLIEMSTFRVYRYEAHRLLWTMAQHLPERRTLGSGSADAV